MKVRVGDKVKFLNETGGGEVTKLLSNEMVNVLTEEGFEYPVLIEELLIVEDENSFDGNSIGVPDEPEEDQEQYEFYKEQEPEEKDIASAGHPDNHVYFALVPVNEQQPENSNLEFYLINDSDFFIQYLILIKKESAYSYFSSGQLEDNTKILISELEREYLNEFKDIKFQAVFFQKGFFHPVRPMESNIKLNPVRLFKRTAFSDNDYFNEPAFLVELKKEERFEEQVNRLKEEDIQKSIREKDPSQKNPAASQKNRRQDTEEVDLHIEELVDNPKELSNREMLEIQMARFQTVLEGAMRDSFTKKVVFIHGVGNGRLKYELRKSLDRNYSKLHYQDASFKEYGYGATLVFLKK